MLHMILNHNTNTAKEFNSLCQIIEALVGPTNSMDSRQLGIILDDLFKLKVCIHDITRCTNVILRRSQVSTLKRL